MPYSGNPAEDASDELRFLIGDTDVSNPVLADAEVLYILGVYSNPRLGAIYACERLAAKFAAQVDRRIGQLSITASQKFQHYRDLANDLRMQMAVTGATPWAGGVYTADKEATEEDESLVTPIFTREMQ